MSDDPKKPWLALGISRSYYYQIRSRNLHPSLKIAVLIYERTGERYGALTLLDDVAIKTIAKTLEKPTATLCGNRLPRLQNNTGESSADSPRGRERESAAADQQEREGS